MVTVPVYDMTPRVLLPQLARVSPLTHGGARGEKRSRVDGSGSSMNTIWKAEVFSSAEGMRAQEATKEGRGEGKKREKGARGSDAGNTATT